MKRENNRPEPKNARSSRPQRRLSGAAFFWLFRHLQCESSEIAVFSTIGFEFFEE